MEELSFKAENDKFLQQILSSKAITKQIVKINYHFDWNFASTLVPNSPEIQKYFLHLYLMVVVGKCKKNGPKA